MNIMYFEELDSTHRFLLDFIKQSPREICIVAHRQSSGIGSRGNAWEDVEGLKFSFFVFDESLPSDLPSQSASIFFGFWFKELLREYGSLAWLKWPNDIYLDKNKIGGVITSRCGGGFVCGVGVNFVNDDGFFGLEKGLLDGKMEDFLDDFFSKIQSGISWKQTFMKYKLEFSNNREFSFHKGDELFDFGDAILMDDGSVMIGENIIHSMR